MSEHDNDLRLALEENARYRLEREETLREAASSTYARHARFAERLYWGYAIVCVALAVAAINYFARSYDTKTLIGSAAVLLVLYETTVLMKLWLHTANLKMEVLKDVKLLRLEMARVATAVGVDGPAEPSVNYEPVRGASRRERWLWFAACAIVAGVVAAWTAQAWELGGGPTTITTVVRLAADGSAETRESRTKPVSGFYRPSGYTFYTRGDRTVRVLDATGEPMPITSSSTGDGDQRRHDVAYTDGALVDGRLRYTQVVERAGASRLDDGVWEYRHGLMYGGLDQPYDVTIRLPVGAEHVSSDPDAETTAEEDGRVGLRFSGFAERNRQYYFSVRYRYQKPSGEGK